MTIGSSTRRIGAIASSAIFLIAFVSSALAERLDVPIYEYGADKGFPTCAVGIVVGLKEDGDGFLAVRTGPGTEFNKIDEIKNGDVVTVYDARDEWYGVMYGGTSGECTFSGEGVKRTMNYPGNKGWVHRNWLVDYSG